MGELNFLSVLSSEKETMYLQPIVPFPKVVVCENKEDAKKVMREYGDQLSYIICLKENHTWCIASNCNHIDEIYEMNP